MGIAFMDPPRKGASNISEKLVGTACFGCPNMEVITSGRRVVRERYWCSVRRGHVDPPEGCAMRSESI